MIGCVPSPFGGLAPFLACLAGPLPHCGMRGTGARLARPPEPAGARVRAWRGVLRAWGARRQGKGSCSADCVAAVHGLARSRLAHLGGLCEPHPCQAAQPPAFPFTMARAVVAVALLALAALMGALEAGGGRSPGLARAGWGGWGQLAAGRDAAAPPRPRGSQADVLAAPSRAALPPGGAETGAIGGLAIVKRPAPALRLQAPRPRPRRP